MRDQPFVLLAMISGVFVPGRGVVAGVCFLCINGTLDLLDVGRRPALFGGA